MKTREAITLPLDDVTTSDAACRVLCELAGVDPSLWLLTADVMRTTQTKPFADAFPDRFLNLGIVEQAMVGVAAGLATCGKTPVVAAFAAMLSMRACEQIRTDLAYADLNVKILASSAGFAAGYAGPTHHSVEDLAILRAMANMTVIVPCDAEETREAVRAALRRRGPIYLRLGRASERRVHAARLEFQIGRAIQLQEGKDVTLIGCGRTVPECLIAAKLLGEEGIGARVLDMHTIKPLDVAAVEMAASQTRMVFSVEEHNVIGGLGGAVAEVMAELGASAPLKRLGMPDSYAVIGSTDALFDRYGLTGWRIAETVTKSLDSSRGR